MLLLYVPHLDLGVRTFRIVIRFKNLVLQRNDMLNELYYHCRLSNESIRFLACSCECLLYSLKSQTVSFKHSETSLLVVGLTRLRSNFLICVTVGREEDYEKEFIYPQCALPYNHAVVMETYLVITLILYPLIH